MIPRPPHKDTKIHNVNVNVNVNVNANVNVNELRLGFSNTTRNPEGTLMHAARPPPHLATLKVLRVVGVCPHKHGGGGSSPGALHHRAPCCDRGSTRRPGCPRRGRRRRTCTSAHTCTHTCTYTCTHTRTCTCACTHTRTRRHRCCKGASARGGARARHPCGATTGAGRGTVPWHRQHCIACAHGGRGRWSGNWGGGGSRWQRGPAAAAKHAGEDGLAGRSPRCRDHDSHVQHDVYIGEVT